MNPCVLAFTTVWTWRPKISSQHRGHPSQLIIVCVRGGFTWNPIEAWALCGPLYILATGLHWMLKHWADMFKTAAASGGGMFASNRCTKEELIPEKNMIKTTRQLCGKLASTLLNSLRCKPANHERWMRLCAKALSRSGDISFQHFKINHWLH